MKKFLNVVSYIFIKPFTALVLFLGNEKFIRFVNKHKILKLLFGLILSALIFFIYLVLPGLVKKWV